MSTVVVREALSSPERASAERPALAARGLCKSFGPRSAVRNVGFEVRAGSIHALLGPNGAGKTTTLRMLLGMVRPDAGSVHRSGKPLAPDLPRGRCGIAGFVETPGFYPYLTASRNLELLSAWDGPAAHRRVEELLDRVGLADRAQSRVRSLSTGMRQRLGIAAALISDPQVLIVDEPTTGLDPAGIRDLHALLAELAADGKAVLLSSHDLDEVEQLCTDVTVLRAGEVVYDGSLAALRARAPGRVWRMHTADDAVAAFVAGRHPAISVSAADPGLLVRADTADLDALVLALAAEGVAVRELRRDDLPFESLFFQLTEHAGEPADPAPPAETAGPTGTAPPAENPSAERTVAGHTVGSRP